MTSTSNAGRAGRDVGEDAAAERPHPVGVERRRGTPPRRADASARRARRPAARAPRRAPATPRHPGPPDRARRRATSAHRAPAGRARAARRAARDTSASRRRGARCSVPAESTSTRGSPVTGTRSSGSENADSSRPRARCDAAGSTAMRRVAPRYIAPSAARTSSEDGRMPLRSVSGESRPMRFSGMPCQSCTTKGAGHRVAVDVAEAVRDHDDRRRGRSSQKPRRECLGACRDAARRGIRGLSRGAGQPGRVVPLAGARSPRGRARRLRCRLRSRSPRRRRGAGSRGWRGGRAHTAGCGRASARCPRRTRRTPPREPIAGWRP